MAADFAHFTSAAQASRGPGRRSPWLLVGCPGEADGEGGHDGV